jgi:hypothetical protein
MHRIICHGQSLGVHENLQSALLQLRDSNAIRTLWIDALCINQDDDGDDGEKASQIRRMRIIYQKARRVVVWLGESSETSSTGFRLLENIVAAAGLESMAEKQKPITSEELNLHGLPERSSPQWRALGALLWREWFTRIWVIQETAVATSIVVCCGNDHCLWSDMLTTAKYVLDHSLDALTDVDPSRVTRLEGFRGRDASKRRLMRLLSEGRSSFATDDRDKIFAIVGLASDVDPSFLSVDYNKDVLEVYTELAKSFIQRDGNLDILSAVENHMYRLRPGLPFWVPDWEVHVPSSPFLAHPDFTRMCAAGGSKASYRFDHDSKCLAAHGRIIDSVDYLGDAFEEFIPLAGSITSGSTLLNETMTRTRPRQWERMARRLKTYPTGEKVETVFVQTLIGRVKLEPDISSDQLPDYYDAWRRYWMLVSRDHGRYIDFSHMELSAKDLARATYIMKGQQQAAYGRRFITTKKGYMGLSPPLTRIGDKIVILLGARTPFILRKMGKGYRFIGECYVHGMMTGEGLRSLDVQEFPIW